MVLIFQRELVTMLQVNTGLYQLRFILVFKMSKYRFKIKQSSVTQLKTNLSFVSRFSMKTKLRFKERFELNLFSF